MGTGTGEVASLAVRLRSGANLTGLLLKTPSVAEVALAGRTGFDLVIVDTEHGAGDGLEHHLLAADEAGIAALVRVPANDAAPILAALDGGAGGVIVPHVLDAEEARSAVSAAHYPPRGKRGLALTTRAGRFGTVALEAHLRRAAEETLIVVQIEDAEAIPRAAEILAVEGVDAVLIGATDLSISLGRPGEYGHPDVTGAIEDVLTAARNTHVPVAVVVATADEAAAWRAKGAQVVLFVATQLIHRAFVAATGAPLETRKTTEPLVLLPGMLGSPDLWTDVAGGLGEDVPVRLGRIDLDESIAEIASSVLAAAPPRFALAGHSLGAIVALEIARRAPERVSRLALVNAGARPANDEQLAAWERLCERVDAGEFDALAHELAAANLPERRRSEDGLATRLEAMARDVGRLGLLRQLAAQRTRPDSRQFLGAIRCPTLVVSGAEDEVCPPPLQEELFDALPNARLATIDGCGHMAPVEAPEELCALMRDWLTV